MKLGIISGCAYQPEDFFKAKERGLSFLEYCVNIGCDWEAFVHSADSIIQSTKETGVTVGSVGRWGSDRITKDGINAEELKIDKALLETAAKIGSPVYVVGCNYIPESSLYENCTMAIAYFKELIALGETLGVKVATYNCRWNNFVHSDPVWSIIHGHLPQLGIKYDISHCAYESDNDYMKEIEKWGRRFDHFHIKGFLKIDGKRVDDPPAGLDMVDWKAVFGLLYAIGYDKGLSIEPHSPTWQGELGEKGVDYTIRYIRPMIL